MVKGYRVRVKVGLQQCGVGSILCGCNCSYRIISSVRVIVRHLSIKLVVVDVIIITITIIIIVIITVTVKTDVVVADNGSDQQHCDD